MDRYSFYTNNLSEIKISLKGSRGQDMPFYVIKNYSEIVAQSSTGIYDFGSEFAVITIMIIAQSSETSTYTLNVESLDTTPSE